MSKEKIYVDVVGNNSYMDWLISDNYEYVPRGNKDPLNLTIFTGGYDVSPTLYDEPFHKRTFSGVSRDTSELRIFDYCNAHKVPMLGICRGSQLLTVANGGKLIQHVTGHSGGEAHQITLFDGSYVDIASSHHQMHYPYDLSDKVYKILGWSTQHLSTKYEYNDSAVIELDDVEEVIPGFKESEIIYFPITRSLGIQGHPEFDTTPEETKIKLTQLVEALMHNLL